MAKFYACVEILLDVESHGEACDALSGLLTEQGIYQENSGIVDWQYLNWQRAWTDNLTQVSDDATFPED
jgi:hypothetical protein